MRGSKYAMDEMKARITHLMAMRRQTLNPFKLDPVQHIYRNSIMPNAWAMQEYLRKSMPFIWDRVSTNNHITLHEWPADTLEDGARVYSFGLRCGKRYVGSRPTVSQMPIEVQEYVMKWVRRDRELQFSGNEALNHIMKCADVVGTWGQLFRLWPTLLSLLPTEKQRHVTGQKCKSALPEDAFCVSIESGMRELIGIFTEPAIAATEATLAEAMMIPKCDLLESHPSVSYI